MDLLPLVEKRSTPLRSNKKRRIHMIQSTKSTYAAAQCKLEDEESPGCRRFAPPSPAPPVAPNNFRSLPESAFESPPRAYNEGPCGPAGPLCATPPRWFPTSLGYPVVFSTSASLRIYRVIQRVDNVSTCPGLREESCKIHFKSGTNS